MVQLRVSGVTTIVDLFVLYDMQAYHRFLTNHPEYRDKVVLVEILLSSWNAEADRERVKEDFQKEVASIKEQFGKPGNNLNTQMCTSYYIGHVHAQNHTYTYMPCSGGCFLLLCDEESAVCPHEACESGFSNSVVVLYQ